MFLLTGNSADVQSDCRKPWLILRSCGFIFVLGCKFRYIKWFTIGLFSKYIKNVKGGAMVLGKLPVQGHPTILITIQILCIGTDRSQQTVQTKIRLLLKKQSDQGLHCLPFHQHLLDALMQCYIKLFYLAHLSTKCSW